MNGACIWDPPPWGPGEGPKGLISLNFNCKVNFIDFFKPNFVCFLTNERYKIYQTRFSFGHLVHAPGVGVGVTVRGWGPRGVL